VPGLPLFYATAFVRRGFAHGVLVETNMGRPTKVEGNPEHPVSLGTTDVFTQASILQMWDPDRSQTVQQKGKMSELSTWAAFEAAWEARRPHLRARRRGRIAHPDRPVYLADPGNPAGGAAETLPGGALARLGSAARRRRGGRHRRWPSDVRSTLYRLDKVAVLLTLDADLFGAEGTHGASAGACARLHRAAPPGRRTAANRLYAMESTPTLTGAYADARLARAPHEIEAALWRIAGLLGAGARRRAGTAPDAAARAGKPRWPRRCAMRAGKALIVAGPTLSPASRALVHLLNQRLGRRTGAVAYIEPVALGAPAHGAALAELAADMRAGRVDTLLMLDTNPVYTAPPALASPRPCAACR
jgi:hypothetical protein